jgi:hypothetical protein
MSDDVPDPSKPELRRVSQPRRMMLRLEFSYDGADWYPMHAVGTSTRGLLAVIDDREDGPGDSCLKGYRLLDEQGRALFVLAPAQSRVIGWDIEGIEDEALNDTPE